MAAFSGGVLAGLPSSLQSHTGGGRWGTHRSPLGVLFFLAFLPNCPSSCGRMGMAWILLVIKGLCVDTWVQWHFDFPGDILVSLLEGTEAAA